MRRVSAIKPAGQWSAASAADRVVLDADDRQRRRAVLKGEGGTELLLDFANPVTLRDGDGLVLDDGSVVKVAGHAEGLIEISTKPAACILRIAWHIGNRHTDMQVVGERLRIRRDHVLEEMLKGLGASVSSLEASFDPEVVAPHERDNGA